MLRRNDDEYVVVPYDGVTCRGGCRGFLLPEEDLRVGWVAYMRVSIASYPARQSLSSLARKLTILPSLETTTTQTSHLQPALSTLPPAPPPPPPRPIFFSNLCSRSCARRYAFSSQ